MNVINALCNLLGLSSPDDVVVDETAVFKQSVIAFLQQHTRLFDLIGDAVDLSSSFSLIKGCVQSGKSRIIHTLCLYCTCVLEKNMVVVVRNFTDDYDQLSLSPFSTTSRTPTISPVHKTESDDPERELPNQKSVLAIFFTEKLKLIYLLSVRH